MTGGAFRGFLVSCKIEKPKRPGKCPAFYSEVVEDSAYSGMTAQQESSTRRLR
jgi:hypothetical protein